MKRRTAGWAVAAMSLAGAAQAALIDRGSGMVYDSTLNITWLSDWNAAQTQYTDSGGTQGSAHGLMRWQAASDWAASLVHAGLGGWRLPSVAQPDASCSDNLNPGGVHAINYGFGCSGSEIGHLFHVDLGGQAGQSVLDPTGDSAWQIANGALFTHLQEGVYWTAPGHVTGLQGFAWNFNTGNGYQYVDDQRTRSYAVAVRDGDVAATAVPEPASLPLTLLALGAGAAAWRRRQTPS